MESGSEKNIDKDARARERAVGKVKKALLLAREERTEVYRDFRRGISDGGFLTLGMSWWPNGMKILRR